MPEVVLFFWIIKILCTTVGETAADFLNDNMGLGLTGTSLVMSVLLIGALVLQFWSRSYTPVLYWLVVVLMSVVGTSITDNMVENFGISLEASTIGFAILLALAFVAWFASERTLSIHSIYTRRREAFYWVVILLTFALGTAAGDLVAEQLGLGYLVSAVWFGAAIVALFVAHRRFGLGAVAAFWTAYILTRPLGASIGDYMSQPTDAGASHWVRSSPASSSWAPSSSRWSISSSVEQTPPRARRPDVHHLTADDDGKPELVARPAPVAASERRLASTGSGR